MGCKVAVNCNIISSLIRNIVSYYNIVLELSCLVADISEKNVFNLSVSYLLVLVDLILECVCYCG